MTRAIGTVVFTAGVLVTQLFAAPSETERSAPRDSSGDAPPNLLAGPDVGEPSLERTLVDRDAAGRVLELPIPAAIAAVDLLELNPATRERVDELFEQRRDLIDRLVQENRPALEALFEWSEIESIPDAPSRPFIARLREDLTNLAPVRRWGLLSRRISAVLPPEVRRDYRNHLRTYERERAESNRAGGQTRDAASDRSIRYWEDLAWEIEQCFRDDRHDRTPDDDFVRVLRRELDLTDEQAEEIRSIITTLARDQTKPAPDADIMDDGDKPKAAHQRHAQILKAIRQVLSKEQRWRLWTLLLSGEIRLGEVDSDSPAKRSPRGAD